MNFFKIDTMEQMEQNLDQYFKNINPMKEEIPLFEALGRYMAEDIMSEMNIPAKGDEFNVGELLIRKGHRISIKDIGLLAAMGAAFVNVFVKPTIAIISTGDEVISIMEDPEPGQVRDVNSYVLAALVQSIGARVGLVALIKDSEEGLKQAVADALNRNDIVLISGESSSEDKNSTEKVIAGLGNPGVVTHGIAMPGEQTVVGVIKNENCCCFNRSNLVVGLPRHPMGAMISYKAIVEPFIRKYFFACEDGSQTIRNLDMQTDILVCPI